MKTESEIRQILQELHSEYSSSVAPKNDVCEMIEMILAFPQPPIDIRKSGASGKAPPQFFSDLTFTEFMILPWDVSDPRPCYEVVIEKLRKGITDIKFAQFRKRNDL